MSLRQRQAAEAAAQALNARLTPEERRKNARSAGAASAASRKRKARAYDALKAVAMEAARIHVCCCGPRDKGPCLKCLADAALALCEDKNLSAVTMM